MKQEKPKIIMMPLEDYQRMLRTMEAQAEALRNLSGEVVVYEEAPGERMN